jgi:hypothetical protein
MDWTPECADLSSTYLVMYHYCQPHVINTLIQWPLDESMDDDPMHVILRLSRDMDEICIWENYQRKDKVFVALYKSLEEKICQLQVMHFPENNVEHVTFGLNLYNLIIRHAMIMAPKRQWRWPSNLEEFEAFTHHIGYDVGGEIVTLAYLRESLLGTKGQKPVGLVASEPSIWERLSCCGGPTKLRDLHYDGPVVRTDHRILFATSFGCHSSPSVSTVYPNNLSEGLRSASEMYCQQHVTIRGNRIILPAVLSWFRADFGNDPDAVVKSVGRFLLPDDLAAVVEQTKAGVKFQVVFDESFDWQPGIAAPETDIEFQFASKDFPTGSALPAFACEANTVSGESRASHTSFVSRLSKIMPSIPLFGRQSSDGESAVKPRTRYNTSYLTSLSNNTNSRLGTDRDAESYVDDLYCDDDDNTTHNPDTVCSALTLGSEFDDIHFQAERSKKSYHRLAPVGNHPQHQLQQQPGFGGGYGYAGGLY